MSANLEAPDFSAFDSSFFETYEKDLQEIDIASVAHEALSDILTITQEDNTPDYATIKHETELFFANPVIAEDVRLLNALATQYVESCASHNHAGADFLNDGPLSGIFSIGSNKDKDTQSDNDDEIDPKTGKKRRKKRNYL